MESVTLTREVDVSPNAIRVAMDDLHHFIKASGFDEVAVDGDTITVSNQVGVASIELILEIIVEPNTDLAYEQRDGIFEEMKTTYRITEIEDSSEVKATTEFALDVALIGDFLDSTVIRRQRRKELSAQFDYLEEQAIS